MFRLHWRPIALAPLVVLGGCEGRPGAMAEVPSGHVDTVIPRDEALRRFQADIEPPAGLSGGAATRDQLVERFIRSVEASDTTALRSMALTKAEFAHFYYPTNPHSRPPYDLSPSLMWFLIDGNGGRGLATILEEYGGQPLNSAGYECEPEASIEGTNTLWGPCLVHRVLAPGDTVAERLFGLIIERGGRYKFVNLANKL